MRGGCLFEGGVVIFVRVMLVLVLQLLVERPYKGYNLRLLLAYRWLSLVLRLEFAHVGGYTGAAHHSEIMMASLTHLRHVEVAMCRGRDIWLVLGLIFLRGG